MSSAAKALLKSKSSKTAPPTRSQHKVVLKDARGQLSDRPKGSIKPLPKEVTGGNPHPISKPGITQNPGFLPGKSPLYRKRVAGVIYASIVFIIILVLGITLPLVLIPASANNTDTNSNTNNNNVVVIPSQSKYDNLIITTVARSGIVTNVNQVIGGPFGVLRNNLAYRDTHPGNVCWFVGNAVSSTYSAAVLANQVAYTTPTGTCSFVYSATTGSVSPVVSLWGFGINPDSAAVNDPFFVANGAVTFLGLTGLRTTTLNLGTTLTGVATDYIIFAQASNITSGTTRVVGAALISTTQWSLQYVGNNQTVTISFVVIRRASTGTANSKMLYADSFPVSVGSPTSQINIPLASNLPGLASPGFFVIFAQFGSTNMANSELFGAQFVTANSLRAFTNTSTLSYNINFFVLAGSPSIDVFSFQTST